MEHRIENLTTCIYSLMDFYLIEKSYPQTREIANFGNLQSHKETGFAALADMEHSLYCSIQLESKINLNRLFR